MKIVSGILALIAAAGLLLAGCDETDQMGSTVLTEKPALVVTTYAQLAKATDVSVYAVRPFGLGNVYVDLAIRNKGVAPVRLTNLSEAALLLDDEGFTCPNSGPDDFTVLVDAKQKLSLFFEVSPAKAKVLRLYGHDFPLPAGKPAE